MKKVIASILLALAIMFTPAVVAISFAQGTISDTEVLRLMNVERKNQGLVELKQDSLLTSAAYQKANDMFLNQYWAHNSLQGKTPWQFIVESGYQGRFLGENLANGYSTSEGVVAAWMASPGHKMNILAGKYSDAGISVVNGNLNGRDVTLVVSMFGGKYLFSTN